MKKFSKSVVFLALSIFGTPSIASVCIANSPEMYDFTGYYTGQGDVITTMKTPSGNHSCETIFIGKGNEFEYECENGAKFRLNHSKTNFKLNVEIKDKVLTLNPVCFEGTTRKQGFGTVSCSNYKSPEPICKKDQEEITIYLNLESIYGEKVLITTKIIQKIGIK